MTTYGTGLLKEYVGGQWVVKDLKWYDPSVWKLSKLKYPKEPFIRLDSPVDGVSTADTTPDLKFTDLRTHHVGKVINEVEIDQTPELITNGSFDSNTDGWTAQNGTDMASVAGGVNGNCLSVTDNNADSYAIAYQNFATTIGATYLFKVYYKRTVDATKVEIGSTTNGMEYGLNYDNSSSGWTYWELKFIATTTTAHLHLYGYGVGATNYFDEVSVKLIPFTSQAPATPLTTNLKAYWKCNETEGVTINDSVGSIDLTAIGGTVGQTGIIDKAVEFANDSEVLVSYSASNILPSGNNFSFVLWVYLHSYPSNAYSLVRWSKTDGVTCYAYLEGADNTVYFFVYNSVGTEFYIGSANNSIPLNTWCQLVFINRDDDKPLEIYVNTVLATGGNWSANFSGTLRSPNDKIQFGGRDDANLSIDGLITEIAYYDKILTRYEIWKLYKKGIGNTYPFTNDTTNIPVVVGEHPMSYRDSGWIMGGAIKRIAQSFKPSDDCVLYAVDFAGRIWDGSGQGNVYAKLYAHDGTYGTDGIPTGEPLATSDSYDTLKLNTYDESNAVFRLTFSGINKIALKANVAYFISIEYNDGDVSHTVYIQDDETAPAHEGNEARYDTGVWTAYSSCDLTFVLYAEVSNALVDARSDTDNYLTNLNPVVIDSQTQNANTHGLASGTYTGWGQSIKLLNSFKLTSIKFRLNRENSPTGNAYAKIYATTGTHGTDAIPSGSALATSDAVDVSTISNSQFVDVEFAFSGTQQYEIQGNACYIVTIEYSGGGSPDILNIKTYDAGGVHGGNIVYKSTGTYTYDTGDLMFYIYGHPISNFIATPTNVIDSYVEEVGTYFNLNNTVNDYSEVGQSFQVLKDFILESVDFTVLKNGSPTGNIVAKVYAHTGTFGTSSQPTGSALATSDNIDVSTIDVNPYWQKFTFSGANRIHLEAGYYVVRLFYDNGTSQDYIGVGNKIGGTHGGNASWIYQGSESYDGVNDIPFKLYGSPCDGSGFIYTEQFDSGVQVQFTPETALEPGTYWWRVRGINTTGEIGEWSETRELVITE